mgnify:CR=1 FL=1
MSTPFKMKGISPLRQDVKKVAIDAATSSVIEGAMTRSLGTKKVAKRRNPSYKEAWANMSKEQKAKHGSYAAFVKAAKKYHAKKK